MKIERFNQAQALMADIMELDAQIKNATEMQDKAKGCKIRAEIKHFFAGTTGTALIPLDLTEKVYELLILHLKERRVEAEKEFAELPAE